MFFTTHRQPGAVRLSGAILPRALDAALTICSGFARRAVGGVFYKCQGASHRQMMHPAPIVFRVLSRTTQTDFEL